METKEKLYLKINPQHAAEKLVPVDFTNETSRISVIGDIGRILRKNISDKLIHRIVALFL